VPVAYATSALKAGFFSNRARAGSVTALWENEQVSVEMFSCFLSAHKYHLQCRTSSRSRKHVQFTIYCILYFIPGFMSKVRRIRIIQIFSTLINVSWAANQHFRMISEWFSFYFKHMHSYTQQIWIRYESAFSIHHSFILKFKCNLYWCILIWFKSKMLKYGTNWILCGFNMSILPYAGWSYFVVS